ncbi:hypothetical protein AURDEDRAFT_31749, partial [Auricularia subglabra TFB-10046 SS5]
APTRLGPFDSLVSPVIPVAIVFVYRNEGQENELIPVDRFQQALERVLDFYPHLTGRLHIDSATGQRSYTDLGAGAELLVAHCHSSLPSGAFTVLNLPGGGNSLVPEIVTSLDEFLKNPILSIKHTRFSCGSVALGVRLPHAICDAEGYFQFVRDLAEVYRTGDLAQKPHIESHWADLAGTVSPDERAAALAFKPAMYTTDPLPEPVTGAPPAAPLPPVTGRALRFSAAQLARLKQKYAPADGRGYVTTFDAITAHIYDRALAARLRAGFPPFASVLTSVNIRPADRLGLPPRYFHNALLTPHLTVPPGKSTAATVHALAGCAERGNIERIARWIVSQPDRARIRFSFPGGFMSSSWSRFDIYDGTAFDGGRPPALVAPPFTAISTIDALVYYLPVPPGTEGGGLDVYLPLLEPLWDLLEQDEEWK